ncbi:MAG TPA: winged helix-turn-helix domain-containing protein [Candidatus Acidoferrum sp.]|nr:winged helix-turn-helix domain-containing protein [Candidatus Acidoferrum sp.]
MSQPNPLRYRFGEYCLDAGERRLHRSGVHIALAPKVFDTLLLLVENPGHLIEKEEFMRKLWPDTFVGDDALARNISILRKVLEGSSDAQSVIATVPKKGYRFVAEVFQNGTQSEEFQTADLWDLAKAVEQLRPTPVSYLASSNGNEGSDAGIPQTVPNSSSPWSGLPFILFALTLGFLAGLLTFYLLYPTPFFSRHVFGMNPSPSIHSVAVLPLQNLSVDPAQEYFSDGMSDALITDLAQIRSLRVISRTSTIRYKKSDKSLPQIARELGVDGIVEGTVQRSGNRVRINAELIEANSDRHLWAKSYESDLQDALTLQSEIARSIAQQIRVKLTPDEEQVLIHTRPVNLRAIEPYLRGRYHLATARGMFPNSTGKLGREAEIQGAIAEFHRAIAEDPNYAPAYVAFASTLVMKGDLSPSDSRQAEEALGKALAIDPDSAEAHMFLGRLYLWEWRWEETGREYQRAIELNPNLADAHGYYTEYLDLTGHLDQGLREAEIAKSLDPASDRIAWEFYIRHQFNRFIELKRNDVASHMFGPMAHYDLGYGYDRAGLHDAAIHEWEEAMAGFGFKEQTEAIHRGYAKNGFQGAIREWVSALERLRASGQTVYPELPAYLYAVLGDKDRAFAWLEKAYQHKTHGMPFLKEDPTWDDVRSDPRFADLERRVGVP